LVIPRFDDLLQNIIAKMMPQLIVAENFAENLVDGDLYPGMREKKAGWSDLTSHNWWLTRNILREEKKCRMQGLTI
jgi:hypothetical protein